MQLDNKQVLVIGGSSGIGLAVAQLCLARGATVTLMGRDPERLGAAAKSLGAGASVRTAPGDIAVEADVAHVLTSGASFDHIAITAVVPYYQAVRELDLGRARAALDAKLVGALLVAKHARLPAGGSLTVTAGIASDRPGAGGAVIAAANGALEALVRALALELAPARVNAIAPGWVSTPVWDVLAGAGKAELFAKRAALLPVGRVGAPEDLAHAIAFLMENGYTTGETLHVDGGHRLV